MPASTSQRRTKPKVRRNSDVICRRSVIYITNIEVSGWGCVLGDKNMAAALIDRTVHHGRLIRFEGRSYCNQHALMTR